MHKILLLPQRGLTAKAPSVAVLTSRARRLGWLALYQLQRWPSLCVAAAQAERARWVLWLPILLGFGVWGYFTLPTEPATFWLLTSPSCALLLFLPFLRRFRLPLTMGLLLALGFNAAQWATLRAMTPLLAQQLFAAGLQGRVVAVEPATNGATLQLDHLEIAELPAHQTPAQIRLRLKAPADVWPPLGSVVTLNAVLMPLSEPVTPDSYDFRRQSFFNAVGAQGFVRGMPRVVQAAPPQPGLMLWVEGLRRVITERVAIVLQGDTAQIATALLNGAQSGISQPTLQSMRASGLFHILSISGLHLAIVAAFAFVGIRRGLALFPALALHWPIKKIAAACALLILPIYTLLVGAPVPAVRSALMTGVVLLAVLVDRRALSLRTVALAAAGLLLVVPQAMLGASFQLSFAAVTVMIAGYETIRLHRAPRLTKPAERGPLGRALHTLWQHGGGMMLTSVLAGVATAPLTLYQFQQANWYGIAANIVGIPLTSFIIMPAGFLAYALMPFGLDGFALRLMGWGIDRLMDLADFVGSWPGATLWVSAFPGYAFALMLFGGFWLCIWQRRWRLLGFVPFALGVLLALTAPQPTVMIAANFENWAIRGADGSWLAQRAGARDFTVKQWRQLAGDADFTPLTDGLPEGDACDALGCRFAREGQTVAYARDAAALNEDCGLATIIVTPLWHVDCPVSLVVEGARLKWQGATSITLRSDRAPLIRSARARWGARPWSPGWRSDSVRETIGAPAAQPIAPQIKAEQDGENE